MEREREREREEYLKKLFNLLSFLFLEDLLEDTVGSSAVLYCKALKPPLDHVESIDVGPAQFKVIKKRYEYVHLYYI